MADECRFGLEAAEPMLQNRLERMQLTIRFISDIYHASGPANKLRNTLVSSREQQHGYSGIDYLARNDVASALIWSRNRTGISPFAAHPCRIAPFLFTDTTEMPAR